jgi:alpha-methylacyl-CoA racemase
MAGPLAGLKVIEMAGIGPGPFCAMVLADLGADVIRVERPGSRAPANQDVLNRSRSATLTLDLRRPEALDGLLELVDRADVLLEGFRPGVMERLGLGPDVCLARNPRLVFGRMTGWGQFGPLAHAAGHDINYIALTGALHAIGRAGEAPVAPLNYVGDFGGGAMLLAVGLLAALQERSHSGKGQVVDAAMTDGSALLSAMMYGMKAAGQWSNERGRNMLDTGAHFYDTSACADGRYIAIGSIEPQFYALLREHAGLTDADFDAQMNPKAWPALKEKLKAVFKSKTREDWCRIMEGTDICFAPVLTMSEATQHPHMVARETFVTGGGVVQPAPAPRFSRTPPAPPRPAPKRGATEALQAWGMARATADRLAQ